METYVDLEILGNHKEDSYLISLNKHELSKLISFDKSLVVRHWDGEKPLILEPYGQEAVRTKEDGSTANNLVNLPDVKSVIV